MIGTDIYSGLVGYECLAKTVSHSAAPSGRMIRNPHPEGISYSQTFHKSLMAPPMLHIQKLVSDPKGSFYSIFCEKIGLYPKTLYKRNKEPPDYDIRSRTRICLFTDQPLIKFMNFGFYRCQIPAAPDDI